MVHRTCDKINKQTYRQLQNNKASHWYYIIYNKDFLPFSDLNNDKFMHRVKDVAKKKSTAEADFFQQINSNSHVNLGK